MSAVIRMVARTLTVLILLIPLILLLPRLITAWNARARLYQSDNAPFTRVAVVFGAGLWRDGSPTPVLRDRIKTAAELYFNGKVEKLLMSGDNQVIEYNEPGAMKTYALDLGVPEEDIVLDYAGRRTYDTCYRARDIFGVSKAILITQGFHLPRALYICNSLGLPAIGVSADQREYRRGSIIFWNIREVIATLIAFWEVHVSHPVPVLGSPEPIFPMEAQ
jgi:SanA protein